MKRTVKKIIEEAFLKHKFFSIDSSGDKDKIIFYPDDPNADVEWIRADGMHAIDILSIRDKDDALKIMKILKTLKSGDDAFECVVDGVAMIIIPKADLTKLFANHNIKFTTYKGE